MTGPDGATEMKSAVRERYARAATEGSGCCDPSCCGDGDAATAEAVSKTIGYSEGELAVIPEDANLGLGCGNPTAIAELTGGRYFRAKDTAGLQDIYRLVDELEPVDEPEAGFRPVKSYYYYPLAGALGLAGFLCLVSLLQSVALRRVGGVQTDAG